MFAVLNVQKPWENTTSHVGSSFYVPNWISLQTGRGRFGGIIGHFPELLSPCCPESTTRRSVRSLYGNHQHFLLSPGPPSGHKWGEMHNLFQSLLFD